MSEVTVALRYAKALIDLAQEQNALEEVKNDMELFYKTVKGSSELNAVLS
jgi:F-type H+-transporting ATPase subunit delta